MKWQRKQKKPQKRNQRKRPRGKQRKPAVAAVNQPPLQSPTLSKDEVGLCFIHDVNPATSRQTKPPKGFLKSQWKVWIKSSKSKLSKISAFVTAGKVNAGHIAMRHEPLHTTPHPLRRQRDGRHS